MPAGFVDVELSEAIQRVRDGESMKNVATMTILTLKRHVKAQKENHTIEIERRRPVPVPVLPIECEADIVTWVVAMQRRMVPVHPWEALEIANQLHHEVHGNRRSASDLTSGWYNRFPLSRARRGVEKHALQRLFCDLTKLIIEQKLDGRRVWNMDETSSVSKHASLTVLALRGSSNVWPIAPETTFHLSVLAAINAAGAAAPPLLILPGMRLRRTTLDGSAILCDGCSSYLGYDAERRAKELGVILLCLPPNATHLIQPLDVAVFKAFESDIIKFMRRVLLCSSDPTISKKEAIAIATKAYKSKANGVIRSEIGLANWLRVRGECRESILVLPPSPARKKGSRKTVDSTEKIIRVEDMLVSPPRKKRRPSTKNTEQQPENAPLSVLESVSSNESVVE
ncbi:LOW QUALITY PROTEIN: Hypothetical protein PHPALM_6620 [Phytophthora palmivora]|uniref:DDE-1 domain-containing protein n=1 Tax=Phytophthora palmivora TaxID=4796 RepID=A0A2P4YEC8_9STRA|nr:LOW QUALITY PROTEIN: Hypothetical protein PHPALM_6620 [Phytophthora palmivora]